MRVDYIMTCGKAVEKWLISTYLKKRIYEMCMIKKLCIVYNNVFLLKEVSFIIDIKHIKLNPQFF